MSGIHNTGQRPVHAAGWILSGRFGFLQFYQQRTKFLAVIEQLPCCSVLVRLLLTAPAAAWVLSDRLGLLVSDWRRTKFLAAVHMRNRLAEQLAVAETSLLTAARE